MKAKRKLKGKRDWKKIDREARAAIKEKAKEKLSKAKDPAVLGRLFLELVIVLAIAVWLAPGINLIPYPENLIGFALVILVYLYIKFGLKV